MKVQCYRITVFILQVLQENDEIFLENDAKSVTKHSNIQRFQC